MSSPYDGVCISVFVAVVEHVSVGGLFAALLTYRRVRG